MTIEPLLNSNNAADIPSIRPLSPFWWKVLFDPIARRSQDSSYGEDV